MTEVPFQIREPRTQYPALYPAPSGTLDPSRIPHTGFAGNLGQCVYDPGDTKALSDRTCEKHEEKHQYLFDHDVVTRVFVTKHTRTKVKR